MTGLSKQVGKQNRAAGRHDLYRPVVSVIIPTHNRAKLLQDAIESALAQTYPNVEMVVVDDGSTDATAATLSQYAGRITCLRQANLGVVAARNAGLRASSGEYVTFLDDDDLLLPDKIARQVHVLTSRPKIGLVHCRYYLADAAGRYVEKIGILPEGDVLAALVRGNFMWVGAPLVRRQHLEAVGAFDENVPAVTADWDLWLRLARSGVQFACIQEPLGAYRAQCDSMMSDISQLERGAVAVLDRAFSASQPRLPVAVAALKPQAYGEVMVWLSCRAYAAHCPEDGQRYLAQALSLYPRLANSSEALARMLWEDALSPRVSTPQQFIASVFGHLPPQAGPLRRRHALIIRQVGIGLALRSYATGDIAEAQQRLLQALGTGALAAGQVEEFAGALSHHAMHVPTGSPDGFVERVLHHLPDAVTELARVRPRVLSEVHIGSAFEAYAAGHWKQVFGHLLRAAHYSRRRLWNRGVASIFLKSMLRLANQGPGS